MQNHRPPRAGHRAPPYQAEPSLDQRSGQQLREHLEAFLNAYNFAKGRPAQPIQIRSNPPHFGTEHLGSKLINSSTLTIQS